jgi:hypothetical protein
LFVCLLAQLRAAVDHRQQTLLAALAQVVSSQAVPLDEQHARLMEQHARLTERAADARTARGDEQLLLERPDLLTTLPAEEAPAVGDSAIEFAAQSKSLFAALTKLGSIRGDPTGDAASGGGQAQARRGRAKRGRHAGGVCSC